ncbi:MAG TPA: hypothetical protein EYG46_13950 [Myxococcales bacterium]|nr:hypothetical protein [Myxococcales bacterium]
MGLAIRALLESLPDDTTPKHESGYKRLGLIKGLLRYEFLAAAFIRFPEFSGRLTETGSPIEGPLDQVVAYITANYEHPEDLVIAANDEDPSLRFYLGTQVVIGWFNPDVEHDLAGSQVRNAEGWSEHRPQRSRRQHLLSQARRRRMRRGSNRYASSRDSSRLGMSGDWPQKGDEFLSDDPSAAANELATAARLGRQ